MFNVNVIGTGLALLQAERTMRDLVPFTTGMAAAKTLKNGYQMLSLQKHLPAARHLDGVRLLQAQLRLLLDKLPDSQPDKMELIRKALQDESQGVMPWSSKHEMLDAIAIWLAPSHELLLARAAPMAPVANAAAAPGAFGSRPPGRGSGGCWICASVTCSSPRTCPHRCHTCGDKFCPGASPAKPPTPCLVHDATPPDAGTTTNALGDRLPHAIFVGLTRRWESQQANAPAAAHAGEAFALLSEAEIAEIEFGIEQREFLFNHAHQANAAEYNRGREKFNFYDVGSSSKSDSSNDVGSSYNGAVSHGAEASADASLAALRGAVSHDFWGAL